MTTTNPPSDGVARKPFRFAADEAGAPSLHHDARLALLACCVATQQAAGFRDYIDLRQGECPDCKAAGFNTGWGVWQFTCGGEAFPDGEEATPCGATTALESAAALARASGEAS